MHVLAIRSIVHTLEKEEDQMRRNQEEKKNQNHHAGFVSEVEQDASTL